MIEGPLKWKLKTIAESIRNEQTKYFRIILSCLFLSLLSSNLLILSPVFRCDSISKFNPDLLLSQSVAICKKYINSTCTSILNPKSSVLSPQTSNLRAQSSNLRSQFSVLSPQTSDVSSQTSDLSPQFSDLKPQTSVLSPQINPKSSVLKP